MKHLFYLLLISLACLTGQAQTTILQNLTLIDGTGAAPRAIHNLVIQGDKIVAIDGEYTSKHATKIDMRGKYIIPLLFDAHAHLGILKGTTMSSANYTPENIRRQLLKFEAYGVGAVNCMGTDHMEIFDLRRASRHDSLPGATIYTAGRGFGVLNGMPPPGFGMDQVFRPETAEEARKDVRELAPYHPDLLKMWVDDGRGRVPKMSSEIYSAIIDEAHKNGLRVAAHLWYLEDARKLVDAGLDVIAHSIRDQEIDDDLLAKMKRKGVVYIPTLSLDEFAYMYGDDPDWINDPFFKAALEPGVYEMITNPDYKNKVSKDPGALVEKQALQTALKNLKKVYDAGIMVALGTDAGAQPVRAMGFSEHMELELMVKAGLTPLQALTVATMNGAVLFRADREIGTIAVGKKANFIVLDKDPTENIRNSRAIHAVWKNGKKVSDGPLAGH
ncbi:MAG TPA: amidohydrolase family protein [Puia sp.]